MEVHHHPDLHHKPKPWKEYFLEFIMIFLAVTLGFFAESIREYRSDRAKEKEYVASFLTNLEQDTSDLKYFIGENNKKIKGLDTLENVMTEYLNNPDFSSFYSYNEFFDSAYQYCFKYIGIKHIFESHNETILQLKNSGGFRLLQRDHAGDSIAAYDVMDVWTQINSRIYSDQETQLYDTWAHIFDLRYSFGHIPSSALIASNNEMKYLYNKIYQHGSTIENYNTNFLVLQLNYARKLIAYLKKVYNIS